MRMRLGIHRSAASAPTTWTWGVRALLFQQIINGLQLGSIYALIALGYTMVYGIVRLINFAHGDIYMVGAYLGYFIAGFIARFTQERFIPTLILAMSGAALLGFCIERFAYRPIRFAPRIAALSTALGVSIFLENFVRHFVGASYLPFPAILKASSFHIIGVQITSIQVIVLGIALLLMFGLQFLIKRTKTGKAMRAVSYDKDVARLMGIDIDHIISVTFMIGSSLAAAAGVLVGIAYPRIDPYMGVLPGLKAFVAAVLGGIGNIPGAMLGGLLMGMAEILVVGFLKSEYRDAIAFAILILVLLIRPQGLLGTSTGEKA